VKEKSTTKEMRNEWLTHIYFFKCKRVTGWPILVRRSTRWVGGFDRSCWCRLASCVFYPDPICFVGHRTNKNFNAIKENHLHNKTP